MLGLSTSVAKVGPKLGLQTPDPVFALGTHIPPVMGAHFLPVVVTCQAEPCSGTSCSPPGAALPSVLCIPSSSLTGLAAPSVVLSARGGSLLLLLLVGAVCLPRPGALASASPASTPLSSLRVCPLSESWESVEAAGRGNGRRVAVYTAGVREGFLEEVTELQAGRLWGFPRHGLGRNEGITGPEGGEAPHRLSTTEICPSTRGWSRGCQDFCSDHPVLGAWHNDENRGQEANPAYRCALLLFFLTCTMLSNFNDEPTRSN